MKKQIFKIILVTLTVLTLTLPMYATVSNGNGVLSKMNTAKDEGSESYRVGYMNANDENGTDYSKVTDAFTGAYNLFEDGYSPTSDVISENGYYSQTYSNANGRNASIYVGKDNKAYSVGYPIYESWNSIGGLTATGYPTSEAYNKNGIYYQNFTNGYVKYSDESVSFINSKSVDKNGKEIKNSTSESINQAKMNETQTKTEDTKENASLNNGNTSNENLNYRTLSGVGADKTGKAGTLEAAAEMNPLSTVVGLVIIATAVILLVSFSYITDKEKH